MSSVLQDLSVSFPFKNELSKFYSVFRLFWTYLSYDHVVYFFQPTSFIPQRDHYVKRTFTKLKLPATSILDLIQAAYNNRVIGLQRFSLMPHNSHIPFVFEV